MRFKSTILFIFVLLIFVNCNNSPDNKTTQEGESTDTLSQEKANSDSDNYDKGSFELESYHNQEVIATYQSASIYAVTTHYYFETEEGQEILVIKGMDEETQVSLPKDMLEELELENELPDANPEFIGNMFTLYFNEKGKVYKVIPIQ